MLQLSTKLYKPGPVLSALLFLSRYTHTHTTPRFGLTYCNLSASGLRYPDIVMRIALTIRFEFLYSKLSWVISVTIIQNEQTQLRSSSRRERERERAYLSLDRAL